MTALQIVAVEILLVEGQSVSRRQEDKQQLLQPESRLGREDRGDDFYSGAGQGQNRLQVLPSPPRSIGPNLLYPGQGLVERALVLATEDHNRLSGNLGILQPLDCLCSFGIFRSGEKQRRADATPTSREQHAEQRSPDRRLAAAIVTSLQIVAIEILLVEGQSVSRRQEDK